jgi:hypothetical protein
VAQPHVAIPAVPVFLLAVVVPQVVLFVPTVLVVVLLVLLVPSRMEIQHAIYFVQVRKFLVGVVAARQDMCVVSCRENRYAQKGPTVFLQ